jgi:hypothetical protein
MPDCSAPAATAFELVRYSNYAAGLNNVATILAELAKHIDGKDLIGIADLSPVAWACR